MVNKFPEFDQYQLGMLFLLNAIHMMAYFAAKYNKENSIKKKRKKEKQAVPRSTRGRGGFRGRGGNAGGTQVCLASHASPSLLHLAGRRGILDSDSESDISSSTDDEEEATEREAKSLRQLSATSDAEDIEHQRFTIKQLIRKLHIVEPVEYVMCLIGKRLDSILDENKQMITKILLQVSVVPRGILQGATSWNVG
jgi:telomerase protein component 1